MTFKPAASDEDLVSEIDEGFGDSEEELADSEANSDEPVIALPPDSESEDVEVRSSCIMTCKIYIMSL